MAKLFNKIQFWVKGSLTYKGRATIIPVLLFMPFR